jgi:hypothetical protein
MTKPEKEIYSIKDYKIIKTANRWEHDLVVLRKGNNQSSTLISEEGLHPICHVLAYFGDGGNGGKKGLPSYISEWAGIHTKSCRTPRNRLRNLGLLDDKDLPSPELVELGKYALILLREYESQKEEM